MTSPIPDPDPRPPDNPVPGDPVPPPAPPEIPPPGEPPPDLPPGPGPDETPTPAPPETEPPSIPEEVPRGGGSLSRALVLGAALLLGGGTPALADEQVPSEVPETSDGDDPCRAEPAQPGDEESREGDRAGPALEDCNGVLAPPTTGDEEIEEPPPDTGTTPVIPPGTLPEPQPEPQPE